MSFDRARNRLVNALSNKRTAHLSHLVSDAKGDSNKLLAFVNILHGKKQSSSLADHDSVEHLITEFGNLFNNKIYAIRSTMGVTEPPYVPVREDAKLDTFAMIPEGDVRKLVMKYKKQLCF